LQQAGEILKFVSETPKEVPASISEAITEAWDAEQAGATDALLMVGPSFRPFRQVLWFADTNASVNTATFLLYLITYSIAARR
jgi:hypothetical protein